MLAQPTILGWQVDWFAAMALAAALGAAGMYAHLARTWCIPGPTGVRAALRVVLLTAIGFVGARLLSVAEFHVMSHHDASNHHFFNDLMRADAGLTWYGGFVAVVMVLAITMRKHSNLQSALQQLDGLAVSTALAYGIGRFACLFSGDGCYGTWTNLPWGMHFEHGQLPSILPVHPTPLYEALLSLTLCALLTNKQRPSGKTLALFLFGSTCCRFTIEFARTNDKIAMGLTLAQLISLLILCTGCLLWWWLSAQKNHAL